MYHFHIYKVEAMAEVNINLDNREEAMIEVKNFIDGEVFEFRQPDYLMLIFDPNSGYGCSYVYNVKDLVDRSMIDLVPEERS